MIILLQHSPFTPSPPPSPTSLPLPPSPLAYLPPSPPPLPPSLPPSPTSLPPPPPLPPSLSLPPPSLQYSIGILAVQGAVSPSLYDHCLSRGIVLLSSLPARSVASICRVSGARAVVYLSQISDEVNCHDNIHDIHVHVQLSNMMYITGGTGDGQGESYGGRME